MEYTTSIVWGSSTMEATAYCFKQEATRMYREGGWELVSVVPIHGVNAYSLVFKSKKDKE